MISFSVGRFARLLLVVLLCTACSGRTSTSITTPTQPSPPPKVTPLPAQAILLYIEGDVSLQRSTWTKLVPTTGMAVLFEGDQLRVGPGGRARMLCPDFETVVEPMPGSARGAITQCPQATELFIIGGQPALPVRSTSKDLPYITAPRFTRIFDVNPYLSWNPIGASTYKVSLLDPESGHVLWMREVQTTTVRYDGDEPLQPEKLYWIEVTDGRATEQSEFRVASPAAQRVLMAQIARIEAVLADPVDRAVAVAMLYQSAGLYANALQILEPVTNAAPGTLALQGQLLMAMKWDSRAYTTYEALGSRVDDKADPELAMEAAAWTAWFMPLDPSGSASAYVNAKKQLFQKASVIARDVLGDKARAARLEQELP